MANDTTIDVSGMTFNISATALANALLPQLVQNLASNPTLLAQLTQAVTTKVLQNSRATGNALGQYAGSTQTAAATSINPNAPAR